jgi:hypothetical protein
MSAVRISLKVKRVNLPGLRSVGLDRNIDWRGGRAEFDFMRAELQAAIDVVSKAHGHRPIDYVGTHHLSQILYAIAALDLDDAATQDAAARWLVSWVLAQPVAHGGGIYADYLDRDWQFSLADDGNPIRMRAAQLSYLTPA